MLSNMPSAERFRLPSMPSAGNLLGTTRTVQPCASRPAPLGRYARTSGGVLPSLPGQNGQKPPFILTDSRTKSVGRLERSVDMMTHRPTMGSLRNSGTGDSSPGTPPIYYAIAAHCRSDVSHIGRRIITIRADLIGSLGKFLILPQIK